MFYYCHKKPVPIRSPDRAGNVMPKQNIHQTVMTVNNLMFGSYGVSTGKTIQYVHRYLGVHCSPGPRIRIIPAAASVAPRAFAKRSLSAGCASIFSFFKKSRNFRDELKGDQLWECTSMSGTPVSSRPGTANM
jgi:hypothetical protein